MKRKIRTKPFGETEIDERQIISFPDGIPGFDCIKSFVLLDGEPPFKWLQACEEESIAFILLPPESFLRSYEPRLSAGDLAAVGCESEEELLIFLIVTIPDNPAEMTANLQGPVIINPAVRTGRQAISANESYFVRHLILEEVKASEGGS